MRILPALVARLTTNCDAWIVGSAANKTQDLTKVRDFDVMVPFAQWNQAALLIPTGAVPNTFGGWKCISEGCIVDVWPDDLGSVLTNALTHYAWHPRSDTRIIKV